MASETNLTHLIFRKQWPKVIECLTNPFYPESPPGTPGGNSSDGSTNGVIWNTTKSETPSGGSAHPPSGVAPIRTSSNAPASIDQSHHDGGQQPQHPHQPQQPQLNSISTRSHSILPHDQSHQQTISILVQTPDNHGQLPLHNACYFKAPLPVIEALLTVSPTSPDTIRAKDNYGWTPLHFLFWASSHNGHPSKDVVERVLSAYPEAARMRNNFGRLPLHIACLFGGKIEEEVLMELVGGPFGYLEGLFCVDNEGKTSVDYALGNKYIRWEFWGCVRRCLDKLAEQGEGDDSNGPEKEKLKEVLAKINNLEGLRAHLEEVRMCLKSYPRAQDNRSAAAASLASSTKASSSKADSSADIESGAHSGIGAAMEQLNVGNAEEVRRLKAEKKRIKSELNSANSKIKNLESINSDLERDLREARTRIRELEGI